MSPCSLSLALAFTLCVLVNTEGKLKQPFGVKMCQRLCSHMTNCSKFSFDISSLSCFVPGSESRGRQHLFNLAQAQNNSNSAPKDCSGYFSRMFKTRSGKWKCEKETTYLAPTTTNEQQNTMRITTNGNRSTKKDFRRLYVLQNIKYGQRCVIDPHNASVTMSIGGGYYMYADIVYISVLDKYLACTKQRSPNLVLMVKQSGKYGYLKKNNVKKLAVDEQKQIIFMLTYNPCSIGRMTFHGKEFRFIWPKEQCPLFDGIVVLSDIGRIFALHSKSKTLFSFTFTGQLKTMTSFKNVYNMALDAEHKTLYYQDHEQILHMQNLFINSKPVALGKWTPRNFVYLNGYLFTVAKSSQMIKINNPFKLTEVLKIRLPKFKKYKEVLMCPIP